MATCWLILALCVAGLWCRPLPDDSVKASSLNSATEEEGQFNDMADSDYPDMITEFLRLSTTSTVPTMAKSSASFIATTPSAIRGTQSTTVSPVTKKMFQVATAKFSPIVVTTTESSKIKDVTAKSTVQEQKTATTPSVQAVTKPAAKEMESNVVQPQTVVKSKQTTEATVTDQAPVVSASKQPQKVASNSLQNVVQLPTAPLKQPIVQQPEEIKVQQQQLAATSVPFQQTSLASNNGPPRQQQQQGFVSQQMVPTQPMAQQQMLPSLPVAPQPMIANPSMVQPHMMSNPSMNPPQMPNLPMFQQQTMRNPPVFQQVVPNNVPVPPQQLPNQQFQQPIAMANPALRPQLPLFSAQPSLANSKSMAPVTNRLVSNNQKRLFIQGSNGTPVNVIPSSNWQQFMLPSFSPNGMQMLSPSVMSSSMAQQ